MKAQATALHVATACPSEDEVLAFATGRLSPERRKAAHLHLDGCEVCQELLNEAVHALALAPTRGVPSEVEVGWGRQFRPGTLVGQRYVIRQFIARGGMGEVYEAFDQDLQERVALKTVTATACDSPSAVRRLKAEVQLARRVSHPNVCRIYDFGTHVVSGAPPTSFLTMEFVEGGTLGEQIRTAGALSVADACALARALLLGLKAAHDAGVLHRDFKSDNVMLRGESPKFRPLILDFGLARAFEQPVEHQSSRQHGLVGTFAYLAPEQLEDQPHTTASDIYSFGVVWYEMLTGELPFKARSSPALTTLDRLTRPVPAPSSKNPQVSAELDAIVLGCLKRAPDERFQTASEVLTALSMRHDAAAARPRRLAKASLATGLVAGLAVGLIAGTTYFLLAPPSPKTFEVTFPATAATPPLASEVAAAATTPPSAQAEPSTTVPALVATQRASRAPATRAARAVFKPAPSPEPAPPDPPSPVVVGHGYNRGWEDPFENR